MAVVVISGCTKLTGYTRGLLQPTLPRDPTSCDVAAIDTGTPFPSEGCPFQIPKEDDSHRTHRSKECKINKNNGLKEPQAVFQNSA